MMMAPDMNGSVASPVLQELLRRRDADLAARKSLPVHDAAAMRGLIRLTDENTQWIKGIVHRFGWPGLSFVGKEGSEAAWLLVQHSDRDLVFQRRCLALLQEAVSLGEASAVNLAHLTDRVLLAGGESQVYGTQLNAYNGRYEAPRLREPDTVDSRRAAAGLNPLEQHLALALREFGHPEPTWVPCRHCGESLETWLPEIGGSRVIRCSACGSRTTVRARISHRPVGDQEFKPPRT